ncbi:hypothetical protein [Limobrevibacterium gyesilva]|uniref:Uncharacterized protein n=1 Tax=Limobrevibacterium gyesilva TaxID=2991712 RepID=A0AA41YH95_9PROT|nr:hypothetical protein [Limobrevibacterium gyesilva]MCW3473204.1 hypothetical protein [Limobrevibacterium gyesilva]
MSETRQKFLCDAVAIAEPNTKLFITVYKVGDGIEFSSGRGETKHGSPRRHWTNDNIKQEIALIYGAKTVELVHPAPVPAKRS